MKHLLVIGQAPSRTSSRPFDGNSGARLADLFGLPQSVMLNLFDFVNLSNVYPGRSRGGKGDAFPSEIKVDFENWVRQYRNILVVGVLTARAIDLAEPPFKWFVYRGRRVGIIPHPSGVNLFYNDPEGVARARRFLREAVPRIIGP